MLRYGYLESDHDPCVLFWGDQVDLRSLAALLRRAPSLPADSSLIDFGCHAQKGETILLVPREVSPRGMVRADVPSNQFHWELDQSHAAKFADLVDELASTGEGHQYLETGSSEEIAVKVSIGEYPTGFLIE